MEKVPSSEIKIGIVGSRRRNSYRDQMIVRSIIKSAVLAFSEKKITIVSGGASGPDTFAKINAELLNLDYEDHPIPKEPPIENKWEFVQRAFSRNKDIVLNSDMIFALVSSDRRGGTENTIEHATILGKKFFLVDEEGRCYLGGVGWNDRDDKATDKT